MIHFSPGVVVNRLQLAVVLLPVGDEPLLIDTPFSSITTVGALVWISRILGREVNVPLILLINHATL